MKSFHGLLDGSMAYFFLDGESYANPRRQFIFVRVGGCTFQLGKDGKFAGNEDRIDYRGLVADQDDLKVTVGEWIATRKRAKA
jgi:hypothetical protein